MHYFTKWLFDFFKNSHSRLKRKQGHLPLKTEILDIIYLDGDIATGTRVN